jgi:hypothetical protein
MEITKQYVDIRMTARVTSAMKKRLKAKNVDQHRFVEAFKRLMTNERGMAGSFTNFLEDELLDHVFGASAYTAPVTLYFLASTTTISDDGTGATEPVGNNYSRTPVTNNLTNFPAASSGAKANGTAILCCTLLPMMPLAAGICSFMVISPEVGLRLLLIRF